MQKREFMKKPNTLPVLMKTRFAFFAGALLIVALVTFAAPQSSSENAGVFSIEERNLIDEPQSTLAATIAAFDEARQFVGYRHEGVKRGERLPNGAKDLGGGLLSDEDYGVTRFKKGKNYMLWLERIVERSEAGVPSWEVRDVLSFGKIKKNQTFLFSYSSPCLENERENLDLIVLAEFAPKTKTYKVLEAWQANIGREAFEPVSIEKIVCR
ncbi:MAG TPA: hypothetical protein VK308_08055 [Pyrinomonadaceae bacterium]|nr:hypothetical protein [Pyrinomonadaceae bacterium]